MSWQKEIDELAKKRALAKEQGGAKSVARQHAKGRLTVRERVETLVDKDSFEELGIGAGVADRDEDGDLIGFTPANYVLGFGMLAGRRCIVGVGVRIIKRAGKPLDLRTSCIVGTRRDTASYSNTVRIPIFLIG